MGGIPYAALNYMVAEANYGGRVTDNKDRVCIICILQDFYTEDILNDEYKFSTSGLYYSPVPGTMEDAINTIKSFPIATTPETFWLHPNASLTASINECMYISRCALLMMASFGAGSSAGDDD